MVWQSWNLRHAAANFDECASPVFENKTAQNLFKYTYPQAYLKRVEGEPIRCFDATSTKPLKKGIGGVLTVKSEKRTHQLFTMIS